MKKIILGILLVCLDILANAQNGLENIIVEKYYISNESDTAQNLIGGILPVGSVTYRIYADLLPGYKFQAVYGVPTHELKISTSTSFFNNEDRGATTPTYSKTFAADNTVMLDSWLSVGGAASGNLGVLKAEDNGISTVINNDGILQNSDPDAGIPLSLQDGFISGTPVTVTFLGITSQVNNLFDATTSVGNTLSTFNGSWAALTGATGPTSSNKVLIAQITTDGIFSFELNVQIGTPTGGTQKYVAKNAVAGETVLPSLTYENIPNVTFNLKALIEGYYLGGGLMNAAIDPTNYPSLSDTVSLLLYSSASPGTLIASASSILSTTGDAQFKFLRDKINSSYYLALKHRNSLETWSAAPVLFSPNVKYDFTTSDNQAFGNNMIDVGSSFGESPLYAIYSGDISDASLIGLQDGIIESQDYGDMENAVYFTFVGYVQQDVTGDRIVESSDYGLIENAVYFTRVVAHP